MLERSRLTTSSLLTTKPLSALAFCVTASVWTSVVDSTKKHKCTQCRTVKSDVKQVIVGEEGKCTQNQTEDCPLRVIVHRQGQ